eukprot:TRINITY_DN11167_c0_g1_i1.p1 TRINITY_DN11167_c0_g1~~TRINITY_DN11167_c0_g1_i1.p1  ORF type:complete len:679 (-),score=221.02 TRINITY_DN11167_c0_g1_i1:29-2065(-)
MEQVIDAISDAVSQLILFSVEAEENNTKLTNLGPGCKAVRICVDALLDVVEEVLKTTNDIPEIHERMVKTTGEIRNATAVIERAGNHLMNDTMNQDAKRDLLEAARDLLQGTVKELHLTDKHAVTRILRAAEACKVRVDDVNHVTTTEGINDAARGLASSVVEVARQINSRIKAISDPVLQKRLLAANQDLKSEAPRLIKALGDTMLDVTNGQYRLNQSSIAASMKRALDEIIVATDQSNKTMFDALDLDFDIHAAGGKKVGISDYRISPEELLAGIAHLRAALEKGSALGAAQGLQMIADAIEQAKLLMNATNDPALKERMAQAIKDLESIRDQLLPLIKRALAGDKAAQAELDRLLARAEARAREIREAANWDELWTTMAKTDRALDGLEDAIKRGDLDAARRYRAEIAELLKKEIELLERLGQDVNDPKWAERLNMLRAKLQELEREFSSCSADAINNPNDPTLRNKLHGIAEEIKQLHGAAGKAFASAGGAEYSKDRAEYDQARAAQLEAELAAQKAEAAGAASFVGGNAEIMQAAKQVADKIAGKTFDETTPEGRMYAAMARVADEMKLLALACEKGDKAEVIKIAQRIQGHIKGIGQNASDVAGKTKDPRLADNVLSAAQSVQSIAIQLKVITAVKAATASNDGTIKAQLVKCAKGLANNLVATCTLSLIHI